LFLDTTKLKGRPFRIETKTAMNIHLKLIYIYMKKYLAVHALQNKNSTFDVHLFRQQSLILG